MIVVGSSIVWIYINRPGNQLNSTLCIFVLSGNHPQQMQCVKMVGLYLEYLLVSLLSLRKPPFLVQHQAFLELCLRSCLSLAICGAVGFGCVFEFWRHSIILIRILVSFEILKPTYLFSSGVNQFNLIYRLDYP